MNTCHKFILRDIMQSEKLKMKVCLIGDRAVGKTSLIRRFVYDEFDDRYITTLGTKVTKKKLDLVIPEQDLRLDIDIQIWDIMGQIGFRQLLKDAYFYNASGALATADCTAKGSLQGLEEWLEGLYSVTSRIPVVIMANKIDLEDSIEVEESEVKELARAHNSPYYYTSAKTGKNVEECFKEIARTVIEHQLKKEEAKSIV